MDETYIKVKGVWKYLYRAVDKEGKTIDFLLTAKRDKAAAITIAGIELMHRIRKGQFALDWLRVQGQVAPAVWEAVLAA